ncbi:MAG: barstar family protein [Clostridia bacterium]|nr:barstar family protein [Clostridia bacterium]
MVNYILDGSKMTSRDEAHEEIRRAFQLSEDYGRNLDALWDTVSVMDAEVIFENIGCMKAALGVYAEKILDVFKEAAQKNPGFRFRT